MEPLIRNEAAFSPQHLLMLGVVPLPLQPAASSASTPVSSPPFVPQLLGRRSHLGGCSCPDRPPR